MRRKGGYLVEKLRYGLVGCGRIAPNHIAAALSAEDELAVTALCDRDISAARALAKKFSLELPAYESAEEMLRHHKLDLTAVATPSGSHGEIALQALRAGSHVLVEKPMALSLAQAGLLIGEAKRMGLCLGVCHQNRFNKAAALTKTLAENGKLGQLSHGAAVVRWSRDKAYYDAAPWRGTWEQDGGAMMNQCIHDVDLLLWMLGKPKKIWGWTANRTHRYIEAEDLGVAVIEFESGAIGTVEGTTAVYPENLEETLTVLGSRGTVKLGGKSVNRVEVLRCGALTEEEEQSLARQNSEEPPNIYGLGHRPLYHDMICAIREGRPPLVDGAAGYRAVETVLALYRSAALGREVSFPLGEGSTLDYRRIW